jgi:hypothetical protein
VRAAVVAVWHAIVIAVPACVAVVGTAVMPIVVSTVVMSRVIAMPGDVVRRGRRNNDHVRAIASVAMVRLCLCRRTRNSECDCGSGRECGKYLLHGNSFVALNQELQYWGAYVKHA